jgi:hypothetical protein
MTKLSRGAHPMSLRSSEVVAGSMFALAFMLVRHDRKKFHEAKISGANAVKDRHVRPTGSYPSRPRTAWSKNGAFELRLRHEFRGFPFRPAVRRLPLHIL